MERKKTSLLILGLSILLLSVVGVTYAYWSLNLQQKDEDKLASSCFDITMENEHDAIKLDKAYPISDKEGEELTPYTFTITNKCNSNAKYQINLESLSKINNNTFIDEGNRLNAQYLKVKLNEKTKEGSMHLLNEDVVKQTLENAYESHRLTLGYLGPRESKTYELRIWLDGDLTIDDTDAMNKTFAGKVTITATYSKNNYDTLVDTILAEETKAEDSGKDGLYKVTHENANITYTTDTFYQTRLQQTEYRYAGNDPNNYVSFETYTNDVYAIYGDYTKYLHLDQLVFSTEENATKMVEFFLKEYSVDANNVIMNINLIQNNEHYYILEEEMKGMIQGMKFPTQEACQSNLENAGDATLITECQALDQYYVAEVLLPTILMYNSEEKCLEQARTLDSDEIKTRCGIAHHAGEPSDIWRIIGLVNTPEGPRVKLIKDESIGNYSWDSSSSNVNDGFGVNEWSQSDLMKLLNPGFSDNKLEDSKGEIQETFANNSLYWDGKAGKCYYDYGNSTRECDFTQNKMSDNLKKMIDTITWNTGSDDGNYDTDGTVSKFYEYERSSNIEKICGNGDPDFCTDEVDRTTNWKGKVGLIYTSDYGYATIGNKDGTDRQSCLNNQILDNWNDFSDCYSNDWLYKTSIYKTLSPRRSLTGVFNIYKSGDVYGISASESYSSIYPSVYLKPDVLVSSGNGSKESPYFLEY